MVIEADMAGNYVGSSYVGRDWSKFVVVLAQTGMEQILESWVKYAPPQRQRGAYGAQFWLNAGGKFPDR
jgi:hypothetical protein